MWRKLSGSLTTNLQQLLIGSLVMIGLTGTVSAQQAAGPNIHVYSCEFVEGLPGEEGQPSEVQIQVALASRNGQPLAPTEIRARDLGGEREVPTDQITFEQVQRKPARIMFVVDTTEFYPTETLGQVLDETMREDPFLFSPNETTSDEIGLVRFDINAALMSAPTDNKGQLFNENLSKFQAISNQEENTAVLYDGVMIALDYAEDPTRQRLVVIVVSDSSHSADQSPTTIEEVVAKAVAARAPIFALMYKDQFDREALLRLTSETGGYFWVYDNNDPDWDSRPEFFKSRMAEYLTQADAILDSEYRVHIPATALTPDAEQNAQVALTADTGTSTVDLGTVNCNVQFGSHDIAFAPIAQADRLIALGTTQTIRFQVDPPPSQGEVLTVKLWFNGALLGEFEDVTTAVDLNLDTLATEQLLDDLNVGDENELLVELYRGEEKLSEETLSGLAFQQQLTLTCGPVEAASCADLTGETALTATMAGDGPIPAGQTVEFQLRNAAGQVESLEITRIEGDSVTITVDDIAAAAAALSEDPGVIEALVFVGNSADEALYISEPVPITLGEIAPEVTVTAVPQVATEEVPVEVPPTPAAVPLNPLIIPLGIAGLLILVDIFLLRRIRVARVKRLMRFTDALDLPDTPMKITVRRNDLSQMHVLSKRTMNLGRGSSNDINLPDDTNVSREHGVVMWRRGQWLYTNRKPETGVTVDQKKVKGFRTRPLRDGTQMQVGEYWLVCHYDMDADPDSLMKTQF